MIELDEDCQRWLLTIRKALDLDRLKSKKSIERPGVVVDLGDGIVFFCWIMSKMLFEDGRDIRSLSTLTAVMERHRRCSTNESCLFFKLQAFKLMLNSLIIVVWIELFWMLIGRIEHARDMGFNHNPALYEGVILVSGDGMVNQFVNGLYMRPDACYAISYTHILYRCSYVRGVLYCATHL